jgi:hypothetical protein
MNQMTRKALTIAAAILLVLSFSQSSFARGWVYLGEAHVDGQADHDKIKIGKSEGRFRALQLKVDFVAIEFRHVVVHYSNGTSEEVQVRQRIRAGGSTRDIDLAGRDRAIDSVEIWYERGNYGRRQRPRVRLFGFEMR